MHALWGGIYSEMTTGPPAIHTTCGGNVFAESAPQGTAPPYVVWNLIVEDAELQFVERFEDVEVQFNLFSDDDLVTEINTMRTQLTALLDDTVMTVAGYTVHPLRRQFAIPLPRGPKGVRQYSISYKVLLEA